MNFMRLKARVENGKLIADAPADYPEGMELTVRIVGVDEMSPEEIAELNRDIESSRKEK